MIIEKHTALYSPLDIEYNQAMSGPYEDLSYRGDDAVVIAGLKDERITGFWRPMVAFGDDRTLKMHIERLWDISQDIYYQDFLINGKLSVISQFLLRHGYKATPYYTQLIDTSKDGGILHSEIRKSYKSLVNKYHNVEYGDISDYRRIHYFTANKGRCEKSWKIQQKMIDENMASCLKNKEAAVLIYHNQYSAYYAGGRTIPNFNSHAVIWQAIIRNIGTIFEMGEQVFSTNSTQIPKGNYGGVDIAEGHVVAPNDRKLVNISKFKRGFGGRTVTRLNLEKGK